MDSILFTKIISALLYPVGLAFLLLVFAILAKWLRRFKFARFFSGSAVLVLLLASNPQVARYLTVQLEQQYPQQNLDDIRQHDAIIVLGGGVRIPLPPAKHTQIGNGSDRFWYAARLFHAGKANKVLVSGGNIYRQNGVQGEAYYASELLQEWGVPESAIIVESLSRTTRQNLRNSQKLFALHNIDSALLVTSAIHMPRSYGVFVNLPIAITPATSDVIIRQQYTPQSLQWIPSSSALHLTTKAMHEYYGMWFNQASKALNVLIGSSSAP